MQVVYSGGSTPSPSPRVQRKLYPGYGRAIFIPGGKQSGLVSHCSSSNDRKGAPVAESSLRDSIPAMKRPVAITCLVMNILLPGLGTFVAGLSTLCGSTIRFKTMSTQKVILSNTSVAFLQFLTAFLFLLGWIWSIVWGVAFLTISDDYFKNFKRPSIALKQHPLRTSLDVEHANGSGSSSVNLTDCSTRLALHSRHLNKPIIARSSSADHPTHPLIIQTRTPSSSRSETSLLTKDTLPDSKPKPNRYLKPQYSEDDSKTSQPLNMEQIMIHSLPKAPVRRGILRREDTITSTASSTSCHDDQHG
ncbi:uncharacterized protein LOC127879758 isoform X1 [Dreissena polymorpha]|uniref:Protein SPEC3 n=1 Tax=Dreissena polymorpha TaxID=45954 RepID=A0A9D4KGF3_DREPO|nr:uncharacterized protein LOC127879758 isoform X1 [Dreissena polymorpha]KAH3839181.1 hypothetical protein DPMN_112606 [Dreissena polymorpha]